MFVLLVLFPECIKNIILSFLQQITCQTCFEKQLFDQQKLFQKCFFCRNCIFFEIIQERSIECFNIPQPTKKSKRKLCMHAKGKAGFFVSRSTVYCTIMRPCYF